jgi:hypothetical protein
VILILLIAENTTRARAGFFLPKLRQHLAAPAARVAKRRQKKAMT